MTFAPPWQSDLSDASIGPSVSEVRGYSAVLTAAFMFGAAATLGTLLIRETSPIVALVTTHSVAAIPFLPYALRNRPARRDWRLFLLWAANGAVLAPLLWFFGLPRTTATEAALLANLEALFTVSFAYAFLKERLPRLGYVGIAGLLVGAVAVTTDFDFVELGFTANLLGNVMIILSALCWGIDNNISRTLVRRYDPRALPFYKLTLGLVFLWPLWFLLEGTLDFAVGDVPFVVLLILLLGIAGVAMVIFFLYVAFKDIGAMRAGALISTSALFGVAVAFAVLGQPPSPVQLGGGILMVVGTLLIVYRRAPS